MNNLIELTKVSFLSGFNVNKKKKNQNSTFQVILIFGLIFLALSCFYNFGLSQTFYAASTMENYVIFVFAIAGMMTMMLSMFKIQNTIFKTKDYEFLESLPVHKNTIIASKLLSLYIACLFDDLIICLPTVVLYAYYTGNVYGTIIAFIAILFISLIPLLAASLLTFIFTLITAKSKFSNLLQIIMYIIFFAFIMGLSFLTSYGSNSEEAAIAGMTEPFLMAMPYLKWLLNSLVIDNWYQFIFFILVNAASAVIVIFAIALGYRKINTWINAGMKHEAYKKGSAKGDLTVQKALMKKEWGMISKKPMYFVNSYLGPFLAFIISIFFVVLPKSIANDPDATYEDIEMVCYIFSLIIPAFMVYMNCFMSSTSASISIESKNAELLKAYPISVNDIVSAKLKIGIIVPLIENIFFGIILAILLPLKRGDLILQVLIVPSLASTTTAYIGMLCGLKWPKLEFANEMQVFKNSMAVNLTLLFSSLLGFFVIGIMIGLSFVINGYISFAIGCVIYIGTIIGLRYLLKAKQEKMFKKII